MNQEDLLRQAAAGDPAAIMRAMRIERENAINRAHASPRSQQVIDQIANASDLAFMKAMGLSDQAFQSDTARGQAAVQEYTQKVRGPERDALELMMEREPGQTQRGIAEVGRRGAIEAAFAGEAARRAMAPSLTPKERRAARDSLKEMREGIKDAPGAVQITGERKPVKIEGAPTGEARQADAFDKMDEAMRRGNARQVDRGGAGQDADAAGDGWREHLRPRADRRRALQSGREPRRGL